MKEVYIVSAKRTPIGGLLGNLTNYTVLELGGNGYKKYLPSRWSFT